MAYRANLSELKPPLAEMLEGASLRFWTTMIPAMIRLITDILGALAIAFSLLLLVTTQTAFLALGILLAVVAYRLYVIAAQQREQTELLALIAEGE